MKNLNRLFKEKPQTKKVDLSFCQLEEIDSLMAELYKFKQMEELNLSCNHIVKLPDDMSILKNLKKIDVTNNLFTNNKDVIKSLKTIEQLHTLMITCTPAEETAILKELPKLAAINRNVIRKITTEEDNTFVADLIKNQIEVNRIERENRQKTLKKKIKLGTEDVEDPQKILNYIERLATRMQKGEEFKYVHPSFQQVLEKARENQRRVENINAPSFEVSYNTLANRFELVEVFFKPVVQLATYINEDFGAALRTIFSVVSRVQESSQSYLQAASEMGTNTLEASSISGVSKQRGGLGGGIIDTINTEKEVWLLRKGEMDREMSALREENKKCYDLIVKLSKNEAEGLRLIKTTASSKSPSKSVPRSATKKEEESTMVKVQGIKALTPNQLRDTIVDIMHTKKDFDAKNAQSGLPRETMEQYLYTYLTKKYGLKNIVVAWATSIITMIGEHSKTDNLVLTFGKILRNEVEEEFFYEQEKSIKTSRKLLESYLRTKYPLKSIGELKKLVQEITEGLISKQQCIDVVSYLYSGNDVKAVELLVDHLFAENYYETTPGLQSKPKVQYKSFEKLVLDYQLSSHEDKLSVFKEIYQNLDPQKKGFLENDDIIKLLEQLRLRKCQYDIGQAKQKLDPMHLGHVTFSSFVEILHHIYSDGTQLSLIQKLGKQCLTLAFG